MLHFARPFTQGLQLRHGFVTADSRALFVAEIFDLPFDQVQRVDAADCLMRRARLFTLRVGQAFERLEEASPRVCKATGVNETGTFTHALIGLIAIALQVNAATLDQAVGDLAAATRI